MSQATTSDPSDVQAHHPGGLDGPRGDLADGPSGSGKAV